jgi:hypothetical protein
MTTRRSLATMLAGLALCLMMAAPARADDDHHGHRGHWEHRGHVHAYQPYYYRSYRYEPGGYYYYTPPPVYVAPPPPSYGLNLVFPLHFR